MNSRKWLKIWFTIIMTFIGFTVGINFFIDPIGLFNYKHEFNSLQYVSNERYQKSVWLKYKVNIDEIDTLLLGASRTTYYNQNKFANLHVFNYAVSSGVPQEYSSLIDYAESLKKGPFKNIILTLDFIGTRKIDNKIVENREAEKNGITYETVLSKYFSLWTLKNSFINIMRSISHNTGKRSYTREDIVVTDKVNKEVVTSFVHNYKHYIETLKSLKKDYDPNYIETLKSLKNKHKSNFIVFTTPIAQPFLDEIYHDEKLKEVYFRWIRDMVEVFDKIYFFTLPSDFSKNYAEYSFDGSHFYPNATEVISNIIVNKEQMNGYGIIITKENIEQALKNIEIKIKDTSIPSEIPSK